MRMRVSKVTGILLALALVVPCLAGLADAAMAPANVAFSTSANSSSHIPVDPRWSAPLLAEIGAGPSSATAGLKGRGVTIGIVDTGVDPSFLPGVALTDWVDVTGEGTVAMSEPLTVSAGLVTYKNRTYNVSGLASKSGKVRVGTFDPSLLPAGAPVKEYLNQSSLAVVAVDSRLPNQYDRVYVDTDYDDSFETETGLGQFGENQERASVRLAKGTRTLQVAVASICSGGQEVVLGFDGHGHGTMVASIIGGRGRLFSSPAPDAKIISVKAVDSSGTTRWDLLALGIMEACARGAKVVVMSVAPMVPNETSGLLEETLRKVEEKYNALVVIASGNKGPGLSTLPDYASLANVLAVGGYIPASASAALDVEGKKLWPWTSIGPTSRGATVSVLAPAYGPAQGPGWMSSPDEAWLFEGTSASAAYAGASAAIVLGSSGEHNKVSASTLKRVLEQGARPIPDAQAVEQGFGLLDVERSVEILKAGIANYRMRAVVPWDDDFQVGGFFDRERIPGAFTLGIDSFAPVSLHLALSLPDWLRAGSSTIAIPAVEQRDLDLTVSSSLRPGLISAFVNADDPETPGRDLAFMVTILNPRRFGEAGSFGGQKVVTAGSVHREYLRIENGLESVLFAVETLKTSAGNPRGRQRMYVYDTNGRLVYESPWIGLGADKNRAEVLVTRPASGVWEMAVVSDPMPGAGGSLESAFFYTFTRQGIFVHDSCEEASSKADGQASGQVYAYNGGDTFRSALLAIEPGKNGDIIKETLVAPASSSITKTISGINEGTDFVYLSAANPSDPAAKMDVFLYFYDKAAGRWTEVASSASLGASVDRYVVLRNPVPGQYMAYIEARNQEGSGTSFTWTVVTSRQAPGYKASEKGSGAALYSWQKGSDVTIEVTAPKADQDPPRPRTLYLSIWDETTGSLKGLFPMTVAIERLRPIVFAGEGSVAGGQMMLTVFAYHPETYQAIDAMVSMDGIWYSLHDGRATVLVGRTNLRGLEIIARYKGLCPAHKTLD